MIRPSSFLYGPFASVRGFELTLCRRFAGFAVCVVCGHAIVDVEDGLGWLGIDPGRVGIGGALVADELPRPRVAIFPGDAVFDCTSRAAPGDKSEALRRDDRSGGTGMRRHGTARDLEGVGAEKLGARRHVFLGLMSVVMPP